MTKIRDPLSERNIKKKKLEDRSWLRHEKIVEYICDTYGASTTNFRRTILRFLRDEIGLFEDDLDHVKKSLNFIPDAYIFKPLEGNENFEIYSNNTGIYGLSAGEKGCHLVCYEIQNRHHISDRRMMDYVTCFHALDEWCIQTHLIGLDRYRNESHIPILEAEFALIDEYGINDGHLTVMGGHA